MIHLPFRFRSATGSTPTSIASETFLSSNAQNTNKTRRQQRINWLLGALCLAWTGILIGCNSSSTTVSTLGDWTKRSDLEGIARNAASGFVINNIAYMGTGADNLNQRLKDFWAYDPAKNAWSQKAEFGGVARTLSVGFSVGTRGYIGTGINANSDRLKDFWEYNPDTNTWRQIPDFAGTARYSATAFSVNNKGYVACGNDGNYLKDMWSYDPTKSAWAKVASYGGSKRVGAVAFVIGNMAYLGTGNNNATPQKDWYVYDATQDLWTQKLDFTTDQASQIARSNAVGFAVSGKGYLVGGDYNGDKNVWQYDPSTDTWTTLGVFEGSNRQYAVGFAINGKGYVTTGVSGTARFDDLWDFDPAVAQVLP